MEIELNEQEEEHDNQVGEELGESDVLGRLAGHGGEDIARAQDDELALDVAHNECLLVTKIQGFVSELEGGKQEGGERVVEADPEHAESHEKVVVLS